MISDELAFRHAPIGLALTEDRVVRRCNTRFCETFAGEEDAFVDRSLDWLYPSREDFVRIGERGLAIMRDTGRYDDERIMRRLSGELFWCRVRGQSLTPDDPFRRAVWSFTDLSEARPVVSLTPREREILQLVGNGKTTKEIARDLGISPKTVEFHRSHLMRKFEAHNMAELVRKAGGLLAA